MQKTASTLRNIQYRIEYALIWMMVALLRLLPLTTAAAGMGFIWRKLAPLNRRYKLAERQLAAAFPDWSADRRRATCDDVFDNLGRTFAETLQLDRLLERMDQVEIIGLSAVLDAQRQGNGMVMASMHSGNWEIAASGVEPYGFNSIAIYQQIRNPYLDAYSRRARTAIYPAGTLPKSAQAARKVLSHVKKGGTLMILADQREHSGVDVPFFGRPAPSTPFPATVARTIGAPLFAGRVVRLPKGRFRIDVVEIPVARGGDRDQDIIQTTAELNAQYERWIREFPGQWMWGHRRWNRND